MIQICTDSCSDLTPELIARYNINIIRLSVIIQDQVFRDGLDITSAEIFQKVDTSGELPKTSAPSIAEFTAFFDSLPGELIFIGVSSKLSATIQNAILASQLMPERKIKIIDSANLSTAIGLLVLYAAELRDQEKPYTYIVEQIQSHIPKLHTAFVIDTLEYLYKGGRCSSMENIAGSLLKIHPIIEVRKDGTLGVRDKTRGTRIKSLMPLLEDFRINLPIIDLHRVFITHSGCMDDANYLMEELKKIVKIENIEITTAGATISSHCGPNTIGILYLEK